MKILRNYFLKASLLFGCLLFAFSCKKDETTKLTYTKGEHLLGGKTTVNAQGQNAFGHPIPQLKGLDELKFHAGNSMFRNAWVTAPASTTARDGLGPFFNASSCAACHFKDGRGRPPLYDGEKETGFLIRLSTPGNGPHGGPIGDPNYGGQLQDISINGITPEGKFHIDYETIQGTFADGESYELRKPIYSFSDLGYGAMAGNMMYSPRVGQQMIGLGLLDALSDESILKYEDITDIDNDGISGKANKVWSNIDKKTVVGRFGWKANQPNLSEQVLGAFLGDMGITSYINADENCTSVQVDCQNMPNGGTPEITKENADNTILYAATLAVPQRRNYKDTSVLKGKLLFEKANCIGCHKDDYKTTSHFISALEDVSIKPYSDLLLHDMGDALADNRPDYLANGNEWRTQPLWGLGLIETVNGHSLLLHDGRARNIEEAILWHGGEAENSVNDYKNFSKEERQDLLNFLKSL
ncbi:MAG: di-heme oxidoredictase family protein [Flavobacteriales bacterium]